MSDDKTTHWTTNAGEKIEYRWMTSAHLWHSHRMLARNDKTNPFFKNELRARGYDPHSTICPPRESPIHLIWLRAIIDVGTADNLECFKMMPDIWIDRAVSSWNPGMTKVALKAMEYRMTR